MSVSFSILISMIRIFIWKNNKYNKIHKIEQIHKTQRFSPENQKGENPTNFLRIVLSQILYHKMIKPNKNKSYAIIYLLFLSLFLSSCELKWVSVCINEEGFLPIYTFKVNDLLHD